MNKRFALWGGTVAAMAAVVILMVRLADEETDTAADINTGNDMEVQAEQAEKLEMRSDDWFKGDADAEVVIVKYSDFQCPACRFYASMDDRLSEELGDDVLFVYRHFPLRNFEHSRLASRYAEAAGRQDAFWEMHDLIYINQQQWSRGDAESIFRQFADSIELDMDQLDEDLQDPELSDRIEADYEDGQELGVRSVPSLFINGEAVENPRSLDDYRDLIISYQ